MMSESVRPWHGAGAENPFEALYQDLLAKVSAVGKGLPSASDVSELKAQIAALEQRLVGAKAASPVEAAPEGSGHAAE